MYPNGQPSCIGIMVNNHNAKWKNEKNPFPNQIIYVHAG